MHFTLKILLSALILYYLLPANLFGQVTIEKQDTSLGEFHLRPWHLIAGEAALYAGSMLALNEAWYKNYPRSNFHFFNDNQEWLQMDKMGHAFATYQVSYQNAAVLMHAGMTKNKAIWLSSGIAFIAISSIEIYDGFSSNWGASYGDLFANGAGAALYLTQESFFNEQIVRFKYGYSNSDYAEKRPNVLGKNFPEKVLKDYNAHSFWLSMSLQKMSTIEKIPPWIALAVGYGAEGVIGGKENTGEFSSIERYRQYMLSVDIDWQKIPVKNKYLKILFRALNVIKLPFPAISYQNSGLKMLWLP